MKAIVLLFTKADAGDRENFPFANLTRVNVTGGRKSKRSLQRRISKKRYV